MPRAIFKPMIPVFDLSRSYFW